MSYICWDPSCFSPSVCSVGTTFQFHRLGTINVEVVGAEPFGRDLLVACSLHCRLCTSLLQSTLTVSMLAREYRIRAGSPGPADLL